MGRKKPAVRCLYVAPTTISDERTADLYGHTPEIALRGAAGSIANWALGGVTFVTFFV